MMLHQFGLPPNIAVQGSYQSSIRDPEELDQGKESGRQMPTRYTQSKPDADNIAKIVLDSLNSMVVVFEDDAQVYDLRVIKTYGDPCLVTEVTW